MHHVFRKNENQLFPNSSYPFVHLSTMLESGPVETKLLVETSLNSSDYDGILLVSSPEQSLKAAPLTSAIATALSIDPSLKSEIAVLPLSNVPAGRLVYIPTGTIDPDYDDVRVLRERARDGMKRALKAGIKKPLLFVAQHPRFPDAELVTILGALEALNVPIQLREHNPTLKNKVVHLGVYSDNIDKITKLAKLATVLESGRRVACDIADADPERMSPPRVEEYITKLFTNTNISIDVVKDLNVITKEYPLFEAVNRAAKHHERHQGRIIYLEYNPRGEVKETLFFVGKGVTMDTGGADVKVGGAMLGMSRDKCGAAAVAGFMQIVKLLQPENVKVVAGLSLVRNSIGSDSYVCDEIITARSGKRVRIINTDAEGRMVIADVLCKFKELAQTSINPHLFTVATLTGHAFRTVGSGYSIVMDNGPAQRASNAQKLVISGEAIGDPFEISTIRREDFASHRGQAEGDDVVQGQNKPSTLSERGHQGPAAFMIMASGLDNHGSGSGKPLKYSHLDIAGSAGDLPNPATGAPVLALAKAFLL